MIDRVEESQELTPAKRALLTIRQLRAKLERLEREAGEPIAIVGMACRLPGGVTSPEGLWEALRDGKDMVSPPPTGRFEAVAPARDGPDGRPAPRADWGGFVEGLHDFDCEFFGLDHDDAHRTDPQQRLLVSLTWEALEDAGLVPERLSGTAVGVFVGSSTSDHYIALTRSGQLEVGDLEVASLLGLTHSMRAARVSYMFDFRGPSLSLDAACSSALMAVHYACESLRKRESSLAIAAGVNAILVPDFSIAFGKDGFLSPDGRCKSFDAGADGFARSEGCGVVALKRLCDALADRDPIRAVIRGSAVNQSGRGAALVAPSSPAQMEVMREALRRAAVDPSKIGYVETHGTGTSLGDAIELDALKSVLGAAREEGDTCLLGSVKANLGHLEAASGVAALIKTVLVLEQEEVPPQIHFHRLNEHASLAGTPLVISAQGRPWRAGEASRFAGVHSYSISGANVHLVLEEAPRSLPEDAHVSTRRDGSSQLLPLSARSPDALSELAAAYARRLQSPASPRNLVDVSYSASTRRTHHPYRLAVVGADAAETAAQLEAFARHRQVAGISSGRASFAIRRRCVFVLPGLGSEWPGMAAELLEGDETFRAALAGCDAAIREHVEWSLLEELGAPAGHSALPGPELAVPAIFSVEIGLAALWKAWGVEADVVVGHGVGELAAAYIAGVLTLADAVLIALHVGRLAAAAPRTGEAVAADRSSWSARLERAVGSIRTGASSIPFYSAASGRLCDGAALDGRTWSRNLIRRPTRFQAAMERAVASGCDVLLDVGPHPLLAEPLRESLRAAGYDGKVYESLARDEPARARLLRTLGLLYVEGIPVAWDGLHPAGGRFVRLPSYPWASAAGRSRERGPAPRWAAVDQGIARISRPSAAFVKDSDLAEAM